MFDTDKIVAELQHLLNKLVHPIEPEVISVLSYRYACGNCGIHFDENDYYVKYCPNCGIPVKWESSNKENSNDS